MTAGTPLADHADRLAARAGEVALCLDFDGTLAPIVDDPAAARPLAGVVELLEPLASRFAAVALISGRPAGYLAEVRQICRDNDILFVADEVITGFGRIGGDWFASGRFDHVSLGIGAL